MDHIIAILMFLFQFALNILPYSMMLGVGLFAGYMFGFRDGYEYVPPTNIHVP